MISRLSHQVMKDTIDDHQTSIGREEIEEMIIVTDMMTARVIMTEEEDINAYNPSLFFSSPLLLSALRSEHPPTNSPLT